MQVCAVCDEYVLYPSDCVGDLPQAYFTRLLPPDGSRVTCPQLHPALLRDYDCSHYFPGDIRFAHVLLSPRAFLTQQKPDCDLNSDVDVDLTRPQSDTTAGSGVETPPPELPICKHCIGSLKGTTKRQVPPKYSIANGRFCRCNTGARLGTFTAFADQRST